MATRKSNYDPWVRRSRRRNRKTGNTMSIWLKLGLALGIAGATAFIGAAIAGIVVYNSYADDLVAPDELAINEASSGATILDRNGELLYEYVDDRAGLLIQLANLPEHPESVPINMLVKVQGTPLAEEQDVDPFDFIRMLAVARIMMPKSHVRLSAGREQMNEQMQALAFLAGANSIFYGEKLLTTANPQADKDMQLFQRLGIQPEAREEHADEVHQAAIEQALVEQRDSRLFYNAAV